MIINCLRNNTVLNLQLGDIVAHVILKPDGSVSEIIDEYVVKKKGLYDIQSGRIQLTPDMDGCFTFNAAIFIKQTPVTKEDIV